MYSLSLSYLHALLTIKIKCIRRIRQCICTFPSLTTKLGFLVECLHLPKRKSSLFSSHHLPKCAFMLHLATIANRLTRSTNTSQSPTNHGLPTVISKDCRKGILNTFPLIYEYSKCIKNTF